MSVASAIQNLGKPMKEWSEEQLKAVISSGKLNAAQASLLLQGAGLEKQDREMLMQKLGLTTATAAQTAATKGLSLSMGQLTKILWAQVKAWAMTPFGQATIAAAGIFLVVKGIQHLTNASDRAREKFDELKTEYEETTTEVQGLESDLDTAKARLDELNNTDSPELVDPEEIAKLERSIELLELQLKLKREEEAYAQREAAEAAKKALTAQNLYLTGGSIVTDSGMPLPEFGYRDIIDELEEDINWLAHLERSLEQAHIDLDGMEVGSRQYNRQNSHIENLKKQIESYSNTVNTGKQDILALYSSLFDSDGNVLAGYEGIAARVELVLGIDRSSVEDTADTTRWRASGYVIILPHLSAHIPFHRFSPERPCSPVSRKRQETAFRYTPGIDWQRLLHELHSFRLLHLPFQAPPR